MAIPREQVAAKAAEATAMQEVTAAEPKAMAEVEKGMKAVAVVVKKVVAPEVVQAAVGTAMAMVEQAMRGQMV